MTKLIDNFFNFFENKRKSIVIAGCSFFDVEFESAIESIIYNEKEINISFSNNFESEPFRFTIDMNSTYTIEENEEFDSVTYFIRKDGSDGYLNITFM